MDPDRREKLRQLAYRDFCLYGPRYTGVGSRNTPEPVRERITALAVLLRKAGLVLRTGEALGADAAFLEGAKWWGSRVYRAIEERPLGLRASSIAEDHHPAWGSCSLWARRLHTRNVYQVLGASLSQPSRFLVCWTVDGVESYTTRATGGTGQAIRIAITHGVPVVNLGNGSWRRKLGSLLGDVL